MMSNFVYRGNPGWQQLNRQHQTNQRHATSKPLVYNGVNYEMFSDHGDRIFRAVDAAAKEILNFDEELVDSVGHLIPELRDHLQFQEE